MFEALIKGLTKKGHSIDVITSFSLKKPYINITELCVINTQTKLVNNLSYEQMRTILTDLPVRAVANLGGNEVCEYLSLPEVQKLLKHTPRDPPPYDVILIEVPKTIFTRFLSFRYFLSSSFLLSNLSNLYDK